MAEDDKNRPESGEDGDWYQRIVDDDARRLSADLARPPERGEVEQLLREGEYVEGKTARRPPDAMCHYCKPAEVPAVADSTVRGTGAWTYLCLEHYLGKGTAPGKGSSQVLIENLVKPAETDR